MRAGSSKESLAAHGARSGTRHASRPPPNSEPRAPSALAIATALQPANLSGISIASLACRDRQRAVLPASSARLRAATV